MGSPLTIKTVTGRNDHPKDMANAPSATFTLGLDLLAALPGGAGFVLLRYFFLFPVDTSF